MSQPGVVTPEAVVLQFRAANVGSRIAAAALDLAIWGTAYSLALTVGTIVQLTYSPLPTWLAVTIMTFLTFGLVVLYPVIFESTWNGRTPGKAALGLRVVTTEGAPVSFRHAAIRSAVGLFEIFSTFGFAAAVAIFTSSGGKRVGDFAAGTIVLRERSAQSPPRAIIFHAPEGAEEFASTLDVSMLTSAEYVTIRAFLLRAESLDKHARLALANSLGSRFLKRIRTRPPEWLTAEGYLLCLATAYQRRFAPPPTL